MADGMPAQEHCIGTPLGDVLVTAHGPASVGFEEMPVAIPALPKGMNVDGVKLFRIRIEQAVTPDNALVLTVAAAGFSDACGGEWLESAEFRNSKGLLQVGLRDCEWLAGDGIVASWASYEDGRMLQTVTTAPAHASMYVSVAWRSARDTDPDNDVSAWFAVELALPRLQKELT